MHHTEYDTRLAAYAVLVDSSHRILLTWYNGRGRDAPKWSLPGGGIEFGEGIEQGLIREVREEAGYDVEVGRVLDAHTFDVSEPHGGTRPFRGVRLLYGAEITGGRLGTLEVGGSTDEARWVDIADIDAAGPRADIVDRALGLVADGVIVPQDPR